MKPVSRIWFLSLLILPACRPYVDTKTEILSVENTVGFLIQAVEDADGHLLTTTFAHDANMVCIGTEEGERFVGWENLRDYVLHRRARMDSVEILTRSLDVQLHEGGKIAWVSAVIDADATDEDGRKVMRGLRLTAVLEKRVGRWMIVQAHLSAPKPAGTPGPSWRRE